MTADLPMEKKDCQEKTRCFIEGFFRNSLAVQKIQTQLQGLKSVF